MPEMPKFDAVIVGAGFAGMYMLHRLRGLGISAGSSRRATDVGGTWYWNRYPGARCDVESMHYSYSFSTTCSRSGTGRERFAAQPEILRYANHVADRFDLRRDIRFDTRGRQRRFDEAPTAGRSRPTAARRVTARFCVMATGCLSRRAAARYRRARRLRRARPTTPATGRMRASTSPGSASA